MNKILHPLLQSLNVDKAPEEIDDLCAERDELKDSLDEIKDERDELKEKLKNLELAIDVLIEHFQGYFYADKSIQEDMSSLYNDMNDLSADVVKSLRELKLEI